MVTVARRELAPVSFPPLPSALPAYWPCDAPALSPPELCTCLSLRQERPSIILPRLAPTVPSVSPGHRLLGQLPTLPLRKPVLVSQIPPTAHSVSASDSPLNRPPDPPPPGSHLAPAPFPGRLRPRPPPRAPPPAQAPPRRPWPRPSAASPARRARTHGSSPGANSASGGSRRTWVPLRPRGTRRSRSRCSGRARSRSGCSYTLDGHGHGVRSGRAVGVLRTDPHPARPRIPPACPPPFPGDAPHAASTCAHGCPTGQISREGGSIH